MAGIFHGIFGLMVGLVAWHLSGGQDGKKRFTLGLVFIFAINNYIGPDMGSVIRAIGNLVGSTDIVGFGNSVHSYFGWIVFSFFWAPLWYVILAAMDRARARRGSGDGVHGFSDVFMVVLGAGFLHHFVDAISHLRHDPLRLRGTAALIVPQTPGMIGIYAALAAVLLAVPIIHRLVVAKVTFPVLVQEIKRAFVSKGALRVFVAAGIAVGNVLVMYFAQAAVGMAGDPFLVRIRLDMAALLALAELTTTSALWWSIAWSAGFLVAFLVAYPKRLVVTRRRLRVDLLLMLVYIAGIILGYMLQQAIGNISIDEEDAGALIHLWALLIYPLVLLAAVPPRGKVDSKASAGDHEHVAS